MNESVRAILEEMAVYRQRFAAFCHSLSAEELATPVPGTPWTVHGYIAHLCTIDALIAAFFAPFVEVSDVVPPDVPPPVPFDIDDWNEATVAKRADASVRDLLAEAARHRASYERAVGAMTDAQLNSEVPFGGDRRVIDLPPTTVRLYELLTAIALHDPNHVQDILRALPNRAEEPAVKEWLSGVDFSRVPAEIAARRA